MKYMHAQLEIIKQQKEIEMLKLDRYYLCHLGHTMMRYSLPSAIYSIYLKSQLVSLQAHALDAGAMCYINIIDQFFALYMCLEELDKNLLCELYQHDLVVTRYNGWDPNPYVGEVQIGAFTSFM